MSVLDFGTRYLDPDIGLWISPDPGRQHHSLYTYGSNNPINRFDPDGGEYYGVVFKQFTGNNGEKLTGLFKRLPTARTESHMTESDKMLIGGILAAPAVPLALAAADKAAVLLGTAAPAAATAVVHTVAKNPDKVEGAINVTEGLLHGKTSDSKAMNFGTFFKTIVDLITNRPQSTEVDEK